MLAASTTVHKGPYADLRGYIHLVWWRASLTACSRVRYVLARAALVDETLKFRNVEQLCRHAILVDESPVTKEVWAIVR